MYVFTSNGKVEKNKWYYVVRHANGDRKAYAVCDTHQKANGLCRAYDNKHWLDDDYNPLFVEKTMYLN